MPALLALADDLTGALEVGAKFAGRGIPSLVTISSRSHSGHPVEVVDLESRHLSPQASAAAVSALAATAAGIVYLKTDSTLRGNIAADLRALAHARPESSIAYVPAYPALGRTVKDGRLHVYGVPVHLTAFAADPLNPITGSSIRTWSARSRGVPCTMAKPSPTWPAPPPPLWPTPAAASSPAPPPWPPSLRRSSPIREARRRPAGRASGNA